MTDTPPWYPKPPEPHYDHEYHQRLHPKILIVEWVEVNEEQALMVIVNNSIQ